MESYYERQITFIGEDAQKKISQSTVIIVGLGGLGSTVLQIIARVGVGTIVLFDDDIVNVHNLSRQQMYTLKDVNKPKVDAAKEHVKEINNKIKIIAKHELATRNTLEKHKDANVLIDCTDRQGSRRIIDNFCSAHGINWVHAAAIQDKGTLCVFQPRKHPKITYNTIYGSRAQDFRCMRFGILATTTGVIGAFQAHLAMQLIIGEEVPSGLFRVRLGSLELEHVNL